MNTDVSSEAVKEYEALVCQTNKQKHGARAPPTQRSEHSVADDGLRMQRIVFLMILHKMQSYQAV